MVRPIKLPSFRRLFTQDYPKEFQKLIDILSVSLNNGIEVLYNTLNNNVTLRDNIKCTVKDLVVSVDVNGTPAQNTAFTLDTTSKVEGVTVITALNQTNSNAYPTSGVFISGSQSTNTFLVNNITGLQPGQQYLLRVIAWQA